MAEYIAYGSIEEADARSAELWALVRGPGWQPGNVTQYLYGREGAAIVVAEHDADLDALIRADLMTPREAGEMSGLYPAWAAGTTYAVDDLVSYADSLWKCRQAHTATDPGWIPPNVPALWLVYRKDADQTLPWVAGEQVFIDTRRTYSGGEYRCIQAHVTQSDWTPPAVPTLWALVPPPTPEWQPWTYYAINTVVTYQGHTYKCRQSHTSQPAWTPPVVPALWLLLS